MVIGTGLSISITESHKHQCGTDVHQSAENISVYTSLLRDIVL